jgi:hypothetical protein
MVHHLHHLFEHGCGLLLREVARLDNAAEQAAAEAFAASEHTPPVCTSEARTTRRARVQAHKLYAPVKQLTTGAELHHQMHRLLVFISALRKKKGIGAGD